MKQTEKTKIARITITSAGGHSSSPHLAANTLIIAAQAIKVINTAVLCRFAPDHRPWVVVKSLKGGTVCNIIPAETVITYSFTAQDEADSIKLDRIFEDIPKHIAGLFGAECRTNLWESKVD